jgi:hypothetical protein
LKWGKEIWEELISTFLLYDTDHIEDKKIGEAATHRQQGDLISLLTKIKGDIQT